MSALGRDRHWYCSNGRVSSQLRVSLVYSRSLTRRNAEKKTMRVRFTKGFWHLGRWESGGWSQRISMRLRVRVSGLWSPGHYTHHRVQCASDKSSTPLMPCTSNAIINQLCRETQVLQRSEPNDEPLTILYIALEGRNDRVVKPWTLCTSSSSVRQWWIIIPSNAIYSKHDSVSEATLQMSKSKLSTSVVTCELIDYWWVPAPYRQSAAWKVWTTW